MSDAPPLRKALGLIEDVRKRSLSIFVLLRYLFLKYYGFPDLLFRWPQAVWHLGKSLLGRNPFPVFVFSSFEIWLRSYYSKLAWNFRRFGRWGYAWDESLGFPMGSRFGSNWATYFIYGRLSPRSFSFLSISLFLISLLSVGILTGQIFLALVLCLILIGSPVVIFSLITRLVKPEVIWWSLAVPLIVFALRHQWTYVWFIVGFLLLVNTSVSVILGAISAALYAWALLTGYIDWSQGLIWLIPGGLLRMWRFLYAYWDGNLGATVQEQTRVSLGRKKQRKLLLMVLAHLVEHMFRIVVPFLIAAWGHWQMGLVLSVVMIGLLIVNEYKFKVADRVTLDIITTCCVTALVFLSGSWFGMVGIFIVVLDRPFLHGLQIAGKKQWETLEKELQHVSPNLQTRNEFYVKMAKDYPWFSPLPFPDAQKLKDLFDAIPDCSRVVLESDGEPRESGKFARFHDWAYYYFADRNIEFINHTFMNRMLEPVLAERYLNSLASPPLSAEVIHKVCEQLGVQYFIAFSKDTVSGLQSQGYHSVMEVKPEEYAVALDMLYMPEISLTLLMGPATASIISPAVTWERRGNSIFWQAEAEKSYIVRYRYYKKFSANQSGIKLKLEPFCPFNDLPLHFMSIQAAQNGLLELKYGR